MPANTTAESEQLRYEVVEASDARDEWIVEGIDQRSEGEIYMTRFSGPGAKRRATEYAEWMNQRLSR